MNLVKVGIYAEGDYSGQTYTEEYFIKEESYNRLKEKIDNFDIYIGDLDGKYSEIESNIKIKKYTEEELCSNNIDIIQDSDDLLYNLEKIYNKIGLNITKELDEINKYLNKIDTYITFKTIIKKSQRKLVEDFIKKLNEN